VQAIAATLNDPDGNLTQAETETLRQQLGDAIAVAYNLTGVPDSTTTAALVLALNSITTSASTLEDSLFDLLLSLVRSLAATAVDARTQFLGIVNVMMQTRGVKSEADSAAITESLQTLALAVLDEAVCGESVPPMATDGLEMLTSYQASYAGQAHEVGGNVVLDYGTFIDFGTTEEGEPICKKSQIVSQNTMPFAAQSAHYK